MMPDFGRKNMKNIKFLLIVVSLMFVFSSVNFAQNATLTALDGGSVSLGAQRGKVVVLAIGATWLPLSKNEAIVVNKLSKKYAGRDVVIYFVATDSSDAKSKNYASNAELQSFVTRNKLAASVLRDSDGAATLKKFNVDQIPAFVVLGKDGKIIGEPFGGVTPDAETDLADKISQAIDKIL
ncbi:MAG: TlpA disulfide reductase family protein [Pyrinomonadaceae bacterium]